MATYCISDIHDCYDKFMALLEKIKFDPAADTIYILGDSIDRGPYPLQSLRFIKKTNKIHLILGNHEQMMLNHYNGKDHYGEWTIGNGGNKVRQELEKFRHKGRQNEAQSILKYLRSRPYYKTVKVDDTRYFLSHAGLDPSMPFNKQLNRALIWSREEFFRHPALKTHICIFGHTPTPMLHGNNDNRTVWVDPIHNDKICIDCGCVFGGQLAALRLDDKEAFYV